MACSNPQKSLLKSGVFVCLRFLMHSSVLLQRILFLILMLSGLIRYDDCFSANVFDQLLRADLVTLLRLALDDSHNSVAVLNSALGCLASVLDNEVEEAALDAQFFAGGHIQPSLATAVSKNKEFRDEVKELKDVQVRCNR